MINWPRIITAVVTVVFAALVLYGAYQYYFVKPIPIVNHYAVSGNMTQTQAPQIGKSSKMKLWLGLYGNMKEQGVCGGIVF